MVTNDLDINKFVAGNDKRAGRLAFADSDNAHSGLAQANCQPRKIAVA